MPLRRLILKLWDTCQHQCIYCVNGDGPEARYKMPEERLLEILNTLPTRDVEFTGGETTIFPDLLVRAVEAARWSPYTERVWTNTNMELLTRDGYHRRLEQAGLDVVHFALYTLDPQQFKEFRGNRNADLGKVLDTIHRVLDDTNMGLVAEFVPMRPNAGQLPQVYGFLDDLAQQYPGRIQEFEIGHLIPSGRALDNIAALQMDIAAERKILLDNSQITQGNIPVSAFCYGCVTRPMLKDAGYLIFPCDAGTPDGMFYIDQGGRVYRDNFSGVKICDDFRNLPEVQIGLPAVPQCQYLETQS